MTDLVRIKVIRKVDDQIITYVELIHPGYITDLVRIEEMKPGRVMAMEKL